MREATRGRVGGWTTGNGALRVLKAWCEVRIGRTPGPSGVAEERVRPCGVRWAMLSLWVGRWRSQVPSVNSPECVEKLSEKSRRCVKRGFSGH